MKTVMLTTALMLLSTAKLAFADLPADAEKATTTAESHDDYSFRPSVMLGLSQWMVFGGGNVAGQLKVGRWAFEYSHGQSLHFEGPTSFALSSEERDAGVTVSMPWTTGGGVGVQLTPHLHALLELKAHRYEVRGSNPGEVAKYTTFTVGPGVFYDVYLYRGLFVQPIVRWWPTVASTYDDRAVFTRPDGSAYHHQAHRLDFFVNVNLGWTFSGV
jgi:hypothetical protein